MVYNHIDVTLHQAWLPLIKKSKMNVPDHLNTNLIVSITLYTSVNSIHNSSYSYTFPMIPAFVHTMLNVAKPVFRFLFF